MNTSDVIIVGAGPVGSTLAALLAAAGVECKLIAADARPQRANTKAPPARALALTLASRNILDHAGAWQRLPAAEIGEFRKMRVWDANGPGVIEFDSAELCLPTLGYIVEQSLLDGALQSALSQQARASVLTASGIESMQFDTDQARLRLADGRELAARLVVAADGFASGVRPLAGIDYPVHEYDQQAVVCTVTTTLPHGQVARQRFLPEGPLAFLPLAVPNHCAVVWSTTPEQSNALLQLPDAEFDLRLAAAFEHVLGAVTAISARGAIPLRRAHAERYCRPRFVLAGDAAHCVHPLAGQGANLGLLDAASLAEVVLEAHARGQDYGAMPVLRRYERWRRGANGGMLFALDGLQKLFGVQPEPVQRLRNSGLNLVNGCAPLKDLIMRLATGVAGDLPASARDSLAARA